MNNVKCKKAYILYANETYFDIVSMCAKSIRTFSKLPIIVYLLNYDRTIDIEDVTTIKWDCDIEGNEDPMYEESKKEETFYINRASDRIYKLLIQRPAITKHALENYAEVIAYIDSDAIVTHRIDTIFDFYKETAEYPYLTEGVYDWLFFQGRGGAESKEDLSTTLEYPICKLFGINQTVRERYRTSNIYVAGQNSLPFIEEWYNTCLHPKIIKNHVLYAPFHEETVVNCLLWKYKYLEGLPYLYINGTLETITEVYNAGFIPGIHFIREWLRVPEKEEHLLFIHGEKRIPVMEKILEKLQSIKDQNINLIETIPAKTWTTVLERGLSNEGVIVDVGCLNWDWCNLFIGEKRVVGIDPIETTIPEHTELFKGVLGSTDGKAHISIYGDSTTVILEPTDSSVEVPMLSWKSFCKKYNIDKISILKINIEGGEYELLYSMDAEDFEKIDQIVVSFHDWLHPEWKELTEKAVALLQQHDFNVINTHQKWGWKLAYKTIVEPKKILFLESHLSTGGAPKFCQTRIESLKKYTNVKIFVVEYECLSTDFVVQRDAIIKLVGKNFKTLSENKMELFDIIQNFNPDIIHIDEMSERLDNKMIKKLYSPDRTYRIVETCHDISFKPEDKRFYPDSFAFCTPYHLETFAEISSPKTVLEFPIDNQHKSANGLPKLIKLKEILFGKDALNKKHVLNVGLWAKWKNQKEGLEIARKYPNLHFHFVGNQAGNFADYWKPLMKNVPENVTIWGERNDISDFMKAADIFMFNSTWECNPLVLREAISYGLPIIARNLPQYGDMFTKYIQPIDTDLNTIKRNYRCPTNNTSKNFAEKHLKLYTELQDVEPVKSPHRKVTITQLFVDNPTLAISGDSDNDFLVKFYDEKGVCQHTGTIRTGEYIKLFRCWYTKWTARVWENGVLIYENTLDYTGKRVFITFDSESLGDSLCWMPYVEEFRKKHNCHVIVCTFKNALFKKSYPELEFVEPGTVVHNIQGLYRIGWYYDGHKEPTLCNTIPLQQTASNILGIDYKELTSKVDYIPEKRMYKYKYVTIATNSTSALKFWQLNDWQILVDHLVKKGYKVFNVSKERNPLNNVTQIKDTSIKNTMHIIYHSEFLISLSSGLSWLASALGKHVVMISNFTDSFHEFQINCTRITNEKVCHGCWNEEGIVFDKGDYNFCPHHKNTPRMFECHKSISAEMVINKIKGLL